MGVECTCWNGRNPSCLVHGSDHVQGYAVLRAAKGFPEYVLGPYEGKWFFDNDPILQLGTWTSGSGSITLRRTDRFERRDDGATARVWAMDWTATAKMIIDSAGGLS